MKFLEQQILPQFLPHEVLHHVLLLAQVAIELEIPDKKDIEYIYKSKKSRIISSLGGCDTYWLAEDSSVLSLNMLGVCKKNFVRTEKAINS